MRIKDLALTTNVGPTDRVVIDQGTANPVTRLAPLSAVFSQTLSAEVLTSVSGTDTITADSVQSFVTYFAGQRFQFATVGANITAAVTLNVNGRGARPVVIYDGTAAPVGALPAAAWVTVEYSGTTFVLISTSAFNSLSVSGTTTLSGLTASTALALNASKQVVGVANTGTGDNVLATSPALTTPNLGTPSAATLTNATGLPLSTGVTGTLAVANGGTGITSLGAGVATWLGTPSSANLAAAVTDETGSGALVFGTSPTLSGATLNGTTVYGGAVTPATNTVDSVGYTGTPVNSQSAAYQLVAADAGKSIVHPISDNNARTFTIPANGTVAFPVGTTITFINMINTVTIAITTDTMYLAGAGTTGSRTLAAYGMATAVKITSTSWIISGNGLT